MSVEDRVAVQAHDGSVACASYISPGRVASWKPKVYATLYSADMIEIPFWQTAPFGVLMAAVLTTISTWLLWWITRRRDDLLESRRTRLEAGVQALRSAYRLHAAGDALLASVASVWASQEEYGEALSGTHEQFSRSLQVWRKARSEASEQLTLTSALASRDVGIALDLLVAWSGPSMAKILDETLEELDSAALGLHRRESSALVEVVADAVRVDAQTDLGAAGTSWWSRWGRRLKRKA